MFKLQHINQVNLESIIKRLDSRIDNASAVIYNEVTALAKERTPYLSGDLEASLVPVKKGNRYTGWYYNVPYAKRIYYGLQSWDWTQEVNPKAEPFWLHKAYEINKENILKLANRSLND